MRRWRADRLLVRPDHVLILAETNLETILATVEETDPALVVIDSIQTVLGRIRTSHVVALPGIVGARRLQ